MSTSEALEWCRWLFVGLVVIAILPVLVVAFIGFWLWELLDKKGSDLFWAHVNDPD